MYMGTKIFGIDPEAKNDRAGEDQKQSNQPTNELDENRQLN
jgi:hypothetical protein